MEERFKRNIEKFIEDFGLSNWKQRYLSNNVKVLTNKVGEKLYLVSSYNMITMIGKGIRATYELKKTLIRNKLEVRWIPHKKK